MFLTARWGLQGLENFGTLRLTESDGSRLQINSQLVAPHTAIFGDSSHRGLIVGSASRIALNMCSPKVVRRELGDRDDQ
jgi:hypothetical protein